MGKKKAKPSSSTLAQNKNARRNYEILDSFEAGISLLGSEIKSIRAGGANLRESYVRLKNSEIFLVGCHISPYQHSPVDAHEPERDRKLLLHRREIDRLEGQVQQKGLTLVPIKLYLKGGRCKIEVGLGKGKKLHDKREDVKQKEAMRDIERAMSRRR